MAQRYPSGSWVPSSKGGVRPAELGGALDWPLQSSFDGDHAHCHRDPGGSAFVLSSLAVIHRLYEVMFRVKSVNDFTPLLVVFSRNIFVIMQLGTAGEFVIHSS